MEGFFSLKTIPTKPPIPLMASCGECGLYKHCRSPKMKVFGEGRRSILICGQSPGQVEDKYNRPFHPDAPAGELLHQTMKKFDVDLDRDTWITNALACNPNDGRGHNRTPTDKEVGFCQPNLVRAVTELKPEIIIPLGAEAIKSLLSWLWKEDTGKMARWLGWQIPVQKINSWVCPAWHPSFILRAEEEEESGKDRGADNPVRTLLWEKHLKKAISKKGRPWKAVPDFRKEVKVIIDTDYAASYIETLMSEGTRLFAFDIETYGLKPDSDKMEIYSASLSNGDVTISYPWHGKAIEATLNFLRSPIPKIGYNVKYENRWVAKKYGFWIRNWVWDGMIAAHVLDNRRDICGLKFQSFVLLGQDSYDDSVKLYLKSAGSNITNRIREADLHQVLLYGGMDSLLEYKVAKIQSRKLGVEL